MPREELPEGVAATTTPRGEENAARFYVLDPRA